jgi:hypothetical protein
MLTNPFPILPNPTAWQAKVDRLGWTAGQSFTAYGLRFGLRANDPVALEQASPHLPLGWQPTPSGEVDILYSLRLAPFNKRKGLRNYHQLYCGSALIARTLFKSGVQYPEEAKDTIEPNPPSDI